VHHHLDKLAGVRLRSDVDAEIASESRVISHIEEAIDNYVPPVYLEAHGSSSNTTTLTKLVGVPICPDLLSFDELGEADNFRGRVVRTFFWLIRWWRP